jgi:SagB-type dehydrogenase family enzyme
MQELAEVLPYEHQGSFALPVPSIHSNVLYRAILGRRSNREMPDRTLSQEDLGAMLHSAAGVTLPKSESTNLRSFRAVASAGALYPIEMYAHVKSVTGLLPGLYHFNPHSNSLEGIRMGDQSPTIANYFPQPELVTCSAVLIFMTGVFERSTFKYHNRGYRFVLLEAGHIAQNLNIVANLLGLHSVNIGGFYDREIDSFLQIDGVLQSTIYITALG